MKLDEFELFKHVNTKVYRTHKWLILANDLVPHYINESCNWKQAICNHIEWSQGKSKLNLYKQAFYGFDDMKIAVIL